MEEIVLTPNDAIRFRQGKEGYSFLYNMSPAGEMLYSPKKIIAKHAKELGVSEDRLRVVMDAYEDRTDLFARGMAAVFVRTEDLEGILARDPSLRVMHKYL